MGVSPTHAKASRTGPLLAFEALRQPVWAPRDYAAFAREGFAQNAIVYRSVRMIAEAAASVPLLLYEGDARDRPSTRCSTCIARPNPVCSAPDLLESWYGFLLVSGNAYLEAVALGGSLRELHALRPDRMKVDPRPRRLARGLRVHRRRPHRALRRRGGARRAPDPARQALQPRQRPLRPLPHRGRRHRHRHPQHRVAAGTRRCSTTRPGPPARSSTPPATATSRPSSSSASRPSWSRASRAPPTPAARCCSKAGSTGSR